MKKSFKRFHRRLKKQLIRLVQLFLLLGLSFLLILYVISKPLESFSARRQEAALENDLSKEEFLVELSPYAQEVAKSHGVRPSLLLAQAALESNWGQSELAQQSNNYFGIKSKEGRQYPTKEFQEAKWEEVNSHFKEYNTPYESVLDYARLLTDGTSWDAALYHEVLEADNYQEAARQLTTAGYATDPHYAEKVIKIIEHYQLNELDP